MPADKQRYKEYRDELEAMVDGLSAEEQMRTVRAQMVDYLARHDVAPNETLRIKRLANSLLDDELVKFNSQIFKYFEDTVELINTLYEDMGLSVARDMQRVMAIEKLAADELGQFKEGVAEELTKTIREGLVEGDNIPAMRKRLIGIDKKVTRYSNTIGHTQVKSYGRTLKTEKARLAGVHFYEYVGLVTPTTRPFCLRMVASSASYHVDDIRQMRNGNREPVLTYCGGWRCKHDWEPDPFTDSKDHVSFAETEGGLYIPSDRAAA